MSNEKEIPNNPTILVKYAAIGSADMQITVENASPSQIWAACKMLEHFANDMYRMQQAQAQGNPPQSPLTVARTLDHLSKAKGRQ